MTLAGAADDGDGDEATHGKQPSGACNCTGNRRYLGQ